MVNATTQRSSPTLRDAAESAQTVINSNDIIPGFGLKEAAIFASLIGMAAIIALAQHFHVSPSKVFEMRITTENALTYHSAAAGIAGFAGTFIASNRLSNVSGDTISMGSIGWAVVATVIGNIVAGWLFPAS